MFLKVYDSLLFLVGKFDLVLDVDYAGPAFAYRLSLKSNF